MTDPVNINQVPKLNLGLQETDEVFITRQGSGPYRVPASSFPWQQKGDKGDPGGSWAPVLALVTDGVRLVHRVVDWVGGTGTKPTALGYVGATGFVAAAADAVDLRGVAGVRGWSPVLAVVEDGARRVQQVVDWTGGAGTKPAALGYIGSTGMVETAAEAVDVRGAAGGAGWSPLLAVVADGERRVHRVVDWVGGTGAKPTTLGYAGANGIVAEPSQAADVRGPQGGVTPEVTAAAEAAATAATAAVTAATTATTKAGEATTAATTAVTAATTATTKAGEATTAAGTATAKAAEAAASASQLLASDYVQNTRISAAELLLDSIAASQTQVGYSSINVAAAATGQSAMPRDAVFRGWGETYTASGATFNAIRLPVISRTPGVSARWRTLSVVVRGGATPAAAGAPVVAVGSVLVNEQLDSLTNVVIVLKDPSTGSVKTLTNADFASGVYFIGVHATTSSGTAAACGEARGTLPNAVGQQYYAVAAQDPISGAWTATAGGVPQGYRMAFEHALLSGILETKVYSGPALAFAAELLELAAAAPEIVIPPAIYGVVGRECNLYFDNLHVGAAADWDHDVTTAGNVGVQQAERWTWTPAAAVTTGTLVVDVYRRRNGLKLSSKTANIRAASAAAQSGLAKKILTVGDSLIGAGTITQTLLDIVTAGDVMPVTLLGTQGTGLNRHEGRGGWTINDYTTAGPTYYDFTVSGVAVSPAINSTEYTSGGSTYRVQVVTLTGGSGTLRCSVVSGSAPSASGTLTKSGGSAGDATIAFSATAAAPGNPFWISGAINFSGYLTANSIAVPDWVPIELGTNDVFGAVDDAAASAAADAAFIKLDSLITSIKAAGAGVKVALLPPPPPSASQDSFGASYGVGVTRARFKRNILIWARQLIAKYSGQEANRVYIAATNVALDTVNSMQYAAAAPVNSRSTVQVARQNNGVHPGNDGYRQMGDALFALIKYIG